MSQTASTRYAAKLSRNSELEPMMFFAVAAASPATRICDGRWSSPKKPPRIESRYRPPATLAYVCISYAFSAVSRDCPLVGYTL